MCTYICLRIAAAAADAALKVRLVCGDVHINMYALHARAHGTCTCTCHMCTASHSCTYCTVWPLSMLFGHSSPFSGFTLLQLTESRGVCEK
jgi:hypothetical protein